MKLRILHENGWIENLAFASEEEYDQFVDDFYATITYEDEMGYYMSDFPCILDNDVWFVVNGEVVSGEAIVDYTPYRDSLPYHDRYLAEVCLEEDLILEEQNE